VRPAGIPASRRARSDRGGAAGVQYGTGNGRRPRYIGKAMTDPASAPSSVWEYRSLYRYLDNRFADTVVLTFAQIESLLGFTLPDLARLRPDWWAAPRQTRSRPRNRVRGSRPAELLHQISSRKASRSSASRFESYFQPDLVKEDTCPNVMAIALRSEQRWARLLRRKRVAALRQGLKLAGAAGASGATLDGPRPSQPPPSLPL